MMMMRMMMVGDSSGSGGRTERFSGHWKVAGSIPGSTLTPNLLP